MIRTPTSHIACSDAGITSAFAHHYARVGKPSSLDTADFDEQRLQYGQA